MCPTVIGRLALAMSRSMSTPPHGANSPIGANQEDQVPVTGEHAAESSRERAGMARSSLMPARYGWLAGRVGQDPRWSWQTDAPPMPCTSAADQPQRSAVPAASDGQEDRATLKIANPSCTSGRAEHVPAAEADTARGHTRNPMNIQSSSWCCPGQRSARSRGRCPAAHQHDRLVDRPSSTPSVVLTARSTCSADPARPSRTPAHLTRIGTHCLSLTATWHH